MQDIDVQKEYFVFQPKYYELKKLNELLRTNGSTSEQLIDFMQEHQLDPNSYIEFESGIFVPIIYQVSLTPNHIKFFAWLLKHGANAKKQPDVKESILGYNILFVCYDKYLKTLIEKCHVVLSKDNNVLFPQIRKKICYGNISRIKLLLKYNVITEDRIKQAINDDKLLGYKVINVLLDRIKLVCVTHNKKDEIDKLLNKYAEIIEYIKPDPLQQQNSITLIQYCINFYLHPIISVLNLTHVDLTTLSIMYHSDLDPKLVAVLRQLYNDRRYVQTCDLISIQPDNRAF